MPRNILLLDRTNASLFLVWDNEVPYTCGENIKYIFLDSPLLKLALKQVDTITS